MAEPLAVVIIGAGFGGIGMAIRLRRAGVDDFVVLEKDDGLGGTWRGNTYPGAACDIPSRLYSFSFAPKLDWTRKYPPQGEILGYLRDCAREVDDRLRFGVEVAEASFDESTAVWRVRTTTGEEIATRVLISACGQLNRPARPEVPGLDDFTGAVFHSACWDHSHDLTGERVAVVGTGASAVQLVPHVAARAARTYVFQRSAPYVIEKRDRPYARWERELVRRAPTLQTLSRAKQYLGFETRALGFVKYPRLMDLYSAVARRHLASQVADPDLRRVLTPGYPMGCKRVLLSNDYYPAIARPDVELVTERIARFGPSGVVTADGRERTVDAVVLGTGFRSTEFLAPMRIRGLGGRDLGEVWRDGARAYLGIMVSGFPNLFLLYGPNTNLGHNSIIYMLESQFAYVLGCLRALRRADLASIDVRPDAQNAFTGRLARRFRRTVWAGDCTSWYKTADGTITNNWPGFTFAYRRATRRPDPRDFHAVRG